MFILALPARIIKWYWFWLVSG